MALNESVMTPREQLQFDDAHRVDSVQVLTEEEARRLNQQALRDRISREKQRRSQESVRYGNRY